MNLSFLLVRKLLGENGGYIAYSEKDGKRVIVQRFTSLPGAMIYQMTHKDVTVVPEEEWEYISAGVAA